MVRVYLAGPDVFFPDALARANRLKALCGQYGLQGVFPLDSELTLAGLSKVAQGTRIYRANVNLIEGVDAVLANMTPFRGPSTDPGTAFEMGYAGALGKPVVGYTGALMPYKDRVFNDGWLIEDFDMVDNLMLHGVTEGRIYESPEDGIRVLAQLFSV